MKKWNALWWNSFPMLWQNSFPTQRFLSTSTEWTKFKQVEYHKQFVYKKEPNQNGVTNLDPEERIFEASTHFETKLLEYIQMITFKYETMAKQRLNENLIEHFETKCYVVSDFILFLVINSAVFSRQYEKGAHFFEQFAKVDSSWFSCYPPAIICYAKLRKFREATSLLSTFFEEGKLNTFNLNFIISRTNTMPDFMEYILSSPQYHSLLNHSSLQSMERGTIQNETLHSKVLTLLRNYDEEEETPLSISNPAFEFQIQIRNNISTTKQVEKLVKILQPIIKQGQKDFHLLQQCVEKAQKALSTSLMKHFTILLCNRYLDKSFFEQALQVFTSVNQKIEKQPEDKFVAMFLEDVMKRLVVLQDLQKMKHLFNTILPLTASCKPTPITVQLIVECSCKEANIDVMMTWFTQLSSIQKQQLIHQVMECCNQQRMSSKAVQLWNTHIKQEDWKHLSFIKLQTCLRSLLLSGNAKEAVQFYESLVEAKLNHDIMLDLALQAYATTNQSEQFLGILQQMIDKQHLKLHKNGLIPTLQSLQRNHQYELMMQLFDHFVVTNRVKSAIGPNVMKLFIEAVQHCRGEAKLQETLAFAKTCGMHFAKIEDKFF